MDASAEVSKLESRGSTNSDSEDKNDSKISLSHLDDEKSLESSDKEKTAPAPEKKTNSVEDLRSNEVLRLHSKKFCIKKCTTAAGM